eukprot:RCo012680
MFRGVTSLARGWGFAAWAGGARRSAGRVPNLPLGSRRTYAVKTEVEATEASVHLTDAFAKRMKAVAESAGRDRLLRVRVEPGGCDGFSYQFRLCDDADVTPEDRVFQHPTGGRCVIDDMSLSLLSGATVDYVTELIGSEFKVKSNPNAGSKCSCGSSFSPK